MALQYSAMVKNFAVLLLENLPALILLLLVKIIPVGISDLNGSIAFFELVKKSCYILQ